MSDRYLVRLRDPATEDRRWRARNVPYDPERHDALAQDAREPWAEMAASEEGERSESVALDLMRRAAHFDARLPGAIQLRAEGWSQQRIARNLGIRQQTLSSLLSRFRASL